MLMEVIGLRNWLIIPDDCRTSDCPDSEPLRNSKRQQAVPFTFLRLAPMIDNLGSRSAARQSVDRKSVV